MISPSNLISSALRLTLRFSGPSKTGGVGWQATTVTCLSPTDIGTQCDFWTTSDESPAPPLGNSPMAFGYPESLSTAGFASFAGFAHQSGTCSATRIHTGHDICQIPALFPAVGYILPLKQGEPSIGSWQQCVGIKNRFSA